MDRILADRLTATEQWVLTGLAAGKKPTITSNGSFMGAL